MIDLFLAVGDCGDLVDHWDLARRDDGVQLRVRSRLQYPSQDAATEVARVIADRVGRHGYTICEVSALARTDGEEPGWRAFVEVLVS